MASLVETLKKLNKGKSEAEKIEILGDKEVCRTRTSTGSPYLDYISGGFMNGGFNLLCAKGGSGKSSISLLACKDVIERRGKIAVYFDAEGTLDDSYFERMGVDKNKFILIQHRVLERMLDEAELFSQTDEVGIIVFDSIPIFKSEVALEKSASDYIIGTEAMRWGARMSIIEGYAVPREICLLGLTHYKKDPGVNSGDNRVLPRGEWQGTMKNTHIDLAKKENIFDKDKNVIGHVLAVRVKKSKGVAFDEKKVFTINFYNVGGFKIFDEYARLFAETETVNVSGSWISFGDENGEEVKVQGVNQLSAYLEKNEKVFNILKDMLING